MFFFTEKLDMFGENFVSLRRNCCSACWKEGDDVHFFQKANEGSGNK